MARIAFIGAGSYGFTLKLVADIMNFEALKESEFSFMDIDQGRLDNIKIILDAHFEKIEYKRKVLYTIDLERALEGADFVFDLVRIGFAEASEIDIDIPKKYGLYQTIGDTCGVGGIFRGLRTMVFVVKLCKMIEKFSARKAVVLNYTNPQAMLVMAANATSSVPFFGLCHSVQGTTKQIARYMEIPYEDLDYEAAGINHMNWITLLEKDGEDIYPEFRKLVRMRGIYHGFDESGSDFAATLGPTRFDMLNRTGYMVTESSDHFAEYVPFYLRTKETREKYKLRIDREKIGLTRKLEKHNKLLSDVKAGLMPEIEKSVEYGSGIINAMVSGQPYRVYANVMNTGLVTNLPEFSAVEVACLVDGNGVHPCHYGALPTQLAAMCSMEINVHQLAVEAILNHDRKAVYWALMMDPVAHSILTIDKMEQLADELIAVHERYLDGYF